MRFTLWMLLAGTPLSGSAHRLDELIKNPEIFLATANFYHYDTPQLRRLQSQHKVDVFVKWMRGVAFELTDEEIKSLTEGALKQLQLHYGPDWSGDAQQAAVITSELQHYRAKTLKDHPLTSTLNSTEQNKLLQDYIKDMAKVSANSKAIEREARYIVTRAHMTQKEKIALYRNAFERIWDSGVALGANQFDYGEGAPYVFQGASLIGGTEYLPTLIIGPDGPDGNAPVTMETQKESLEKIGGYKKFIPSGPVKAKPSRKCAQTLGTQT